MFESGDGCEWGVGVKVMWKPNHKTYRRLHRGFSSFWRVGTHHRDFVFRLRFFFLLGRSIVEVDVFVAPAAHLDCCESGFRLVEADCA